MESNQEIGSGENSRKMKNDNPVYGRVRDVEKMYGLKRATVYNLLAAGKIRGCALKVKGQERCRIRLIELESVRVFISSEVRAQMQEVAR